MRLNQRQTKRQILSLFANDFSCVEQPIFRTKIDAAKVDLQKWTTSSILLSILDFKF